SAVAEALGAIGPEAISAAPALRFALKDRKKNVAREAASALGKIDPTSQDAIATLTEFLNDEGLVFRCRCALALGEIGPTARAAIPGLMRMLTNSPPHDDRYALEALKKIDLDAANKFITEMLEQGRTAPHASIIEN